MDITIKFGTIDGPGKVLASAYLTCSGVGNILFDDEELHWGMNGKGTSAFYNTAVHEVGHVIGVYHSKVKPSVMNGGSTSYEFGLFNDDITAVQVRRNCSTAYRVNSILHFSWAVHSLGIYACISIPHASFYTLTLIHDSNVFTGTLRAEIRREDSLIYYRVLPDVNTEDFELYI